MQIEKENDQIDHNLYSRQIGAFGVEAMAKLVKMKILLVGLSGLGLETAKNLILSGPKQVTLWDDKICTQKDFQYNYYLKQQHVDNKMNRAEAILGDLKELNSYVNVNTLNTPNFESLINDDVVSQFDIVILTDLYPLQQVYQLNKLLKEKNIALIVSACVGLLGFCFNDFGKQHYVFDKNGEPIKHVLITSIDKSGIVTTDEKQRHDLEDGDHVLFEEVVGMEELNGQTLKVEKVISPFSFQIDLSKFPDIKEYVRNGSIKEVKQKIPMDFEIFEEYLEKPHIDMMDCDMNFENMDRVFQLKLVLKVLWRFIDNMGLPNLYDDSKFNEFKDLLKTELEVEIKKYEDHLSSENEQVSKKEWMDIIDTDLVYLIYNLSSGHYPAITSFFGGIVAQEAVKKTGKFTPLNQMFVHEFYTHLFKNRKQEQIQQLKQDVQKYENSRYQSQVALLGDQLFNKFKKQKVLMVGSGALGCEYLKMFAMIGLSCDNEGKFTVVDDDQIEVSNLNRQFLFRQKHVGQSKSKVSCEVTRQFNNDFNAVNIESRLQPKTEDEFHDEFWDSLNFIVNAVDNIKARQYVDSKAVFHDKALFESGTLGTKCNSQLILPKLTEAYSDSQDPPEKTVPMCTMRSFPYLIDHCIEWARTKFYEIFVNPSVFLHEFFENPTEAQTNIQKKMKTDMVELKTLTEFINLYIPLLTKPTVEEFVKVALQLYQEYFDASIQELITLFPPDYVDKEGKLFWTSPKRPPVPLQFDKTNTDHQNFVLTTVKVLNSVVPIQEQVTDDIVLNFLKDYKVTRRKMQSKTVNREDLTNENNNQNNKHSSEDEQNILNMTNQLLNIVSKRKDVVVNEVEFEKDDDSNGHIDFISFYSNFRAMNYSIKPAPRHKIKMKAGKIIPAIATSTAMVCGAVAMEIYKYMLQVDFESYRNFFSTLALPMFNFSEPNPPLVQKDKDYDVIMMGPVKTIPKNWNTWSKIHVKGPMTLQQMNDSIKEQYNFNVSSIVCGDMQVWTNFMPKDQYRLKMNIEDILESIGKKRMEKQRYQAFFVSGEDENDVDISCPVVKYEF